MPLPCYRWTVTPIESESILVPEMLRQWHRVRKLRGEVASLAINGRPVDAASLERLNLWLGADGAWRTSLLSHFEADRVLARVLREGGAVYGGTTSGGRWPAGTTAEELFRDRSQRVQGELRPQFRKAG
jgi:hypothetical protein